MLNFFRFVYSSLSRNTKYSKTLSAVPAVYSAVPAVYGDLSVEFFFFLNLKTLPILDNLCKNALRKGM